MKKLLIIPLVTFLTFNLIAQESSVGLRCGGLSAVTLKFSEDNGIGFELMAGTQDKGMRFTGLIEKYHTPGFYHSTDLRIYTGIGGHAGFSRYRVRETSIIGDTHYYYEYQHTSPVVGGDFILGAEYKFASVPLSLSLDYKPYFDLFGEKNFQLDLWDFGLSIRYVFNNLKS